jgi:hypothetical protein
VNLNIPGPVPINPNVSVLFEQVDNYFFITLCNHIKKLYYIYKINRKEAFMRAGEPGSEPSPEEIIRQQRAVEQLKYERGLGPKPDWLIVDRSHLEKQLDKQQSDEGTKARFIQDVAHQIYIDLYGDEGLGDHFSAPDNDPSNETMLILNRITNYIQGFLDDPEAPHRADDIIRGVEVLMRKDAEEG